MKKMMKDVTDYTKSGIMMGVGADIVNKTDVTGIGANKGISGLASFMPIVGTVTGTGWTMNALKKMKKI